ncbi:hypothetical protein L210DRAFT_3503542 [Boletus edulis BED1]|uniref:Uncharacterized protein n=1 Tax=Boletus edulis BED1 TaxID=1328754 RepID=A0AAD4BWE2_BOLED|nr:hypothetical protein L210DRAFT_3503542 [Boletus edulis BED1]
MWFRRGTVVNWFSEKLEFRVRERPSAAPIPDPIEPVLTLRANMRGTDGLSPSVGDSGCHAFNRIGLLPGPLNTSGSNTSSSCTASESVEADEPDGARLFKMWRYAPWMSILANGDFQAIRGLQSKHEAVCCFEEGFGAEMASIAKATVVIPQRAELRPRLGCTACPCNTNPLADVDPGRLTQDQRPTPPMPTMYLEAVSPSPSAPPSPDLSSFPSQSWSIIANVDIEQILTICGDEDLFGMDYVQNSSVPTTPTDSCGPPMLCSSSPTQSPSLTVAEASDEDLSGTNIDIEQISMPVMICGNEDLSGMDYAQNSSVSTTPTDSCGPPMLSSSSPTQSPSLTVAEASDEDLSGINVVIEQISTPVMICGDEDYAQRSGVPTTPTDSCGPPMLGSSSPTQSPSLTVAEASDEDLSGINVDIEQILTPVTICGDEDYAQRSGVPTMPTDSCGTPMLGSSSPTQSPSLVVAEASDEDLSGTNIDIEQILTLVTICGDEDISGMDYAQNSSVPTTPIDSCGPPALGSSSHLQLSSLTIVEPSLGSANATVESDDASGMGIQTKGSSNDTSQTDLSMVTPARNAATSTVPTKVTDNDPATSMTVAAGTVVRCKFGYIPHRHLLTKTLADGKLQTTRL